MNPQAKCRARFEILYPNRSRVVYSFRGQRGARPPNHAPEPSLREHAFCSALFAILFRQGFVGLGFCTGFIGMFTDPWLCSCIACAVRGVIPGASTNSAALHPEAKNKNSEHSRQRKKPQSHFKHEDNKE